LSRYTGAVCKLCRAEGMKLYLKSDRCNSFKCAFEKKSYGPGMHGGSRKFKKSEFGVQLREKQKVKRLYCLLEKQFKRYFQMSEKKEGITGNNLLVFLESRFDNCVYKSGLVKSKNQARQLIVHGHFLINRKKVNKPSFLLSEGDIISVRDRSKDLFLFKEIKDNNKNVANIPDWIEFDISKLEIKILRLPNRDDVSTSINEQLIVELYSK